MAAALAVAVTLLAGNAASAAQAPVGLGTAGSFAVLAGSGITNTGPTTITGDVGTFPTPSETGFGSVTLTGTNHDADAVTQQAKNDLVTAYNSAAGRTPAASEPVQLGGLTLDPGAYTGGTFQITGTLTLNAHGDPSAVFIFEVGSTLTTASNSAVALINGASPCNVYWQLGSSGTLGTATSFVGTIIALTSITATTGTSVRGRLLARNGAVTLDTTTINTGGCAAGGTTTTALAATTTTAGATTTTPGATTTTAANGGATSIPGAVTTTTAPGSRGATGSPGTSGTPGAPGAPGAPGTATPTPASPRLPITGQSTGRLLAAVCTLLSLGTVALWVGRRRFRHSRRGWWG